MNASSILPTVSVVIPCRNESRYIERCVADILAQRLGDGPLECEVIIADGMSDDGTREMLSGLEAINPRIRVVDNAAGIVSTGLNAAILAARGNIIIRMDSHTRYADNYIDMCIRTLISTGADNVGGPWTPVGDGWLGRAIAAAFTSPFSAGGARSHDTRYEGPVDTVYLGCWRKETLMKIGMFDEEMVRNQDDELNLRFTRAGARIWQSPGIKSRYTCRSSLRALFRQYSQYGYWKVRVIRKHGIPASPRHLVPAIFVAGVLIGWVPGFFWHPWLVAYLSAMAAYLLLSILFSLRSALANGWAIAPVLPAVFFVFHFAYGWGFMLGLVDSVLRGTPRAAMTVLTRGNPPGSGRTK